MQVLSSGNHSELVEKGLVCCSRSRKSASHSRLPCCALYVMLLSCSIVAMVAMVAPSLYPTTYISRQLRAHFTYLLFLTSLTTQQTLLCIMASQSSGLLLPLVASSFLSFPQVHCFTVKVKATMAHQISFRLTVEYLKHTTNTLSASITRHNTTTPTPLPIILKVGQLPLAILQS